MDLFGNSEPNEITAELAQIETEDPHAKQESQTPDTDCQQRNENETPQSKADEKTTQQAGDNIETSEHYESERGCGSAVDIQGDGTKIESRTKATENTVTEGKAEDNKEAVEGEEPKTQEDSVFKENQKFETLEECLAQIRRYMDYLKELKTYDNKEVLTILKTIGKIYYSFGKTSQRLTISTLLVNLGFPEQVKKMTIYFNRVGLFTHDDVWFPCYYNYSTVWNFTDSSKVLAQALTEVGMVHYYILNLSHPGYLENRSSKNVYYVLKSSISTLQNLLRHCPDSRRIFDDENTTKVLLPFLDDKDDFMKCVAILTLSALISEDEAAKMEDTGYIAFIVKAIRVALKSPKRRYRGFTPLELVEGLARIAVSDYNKKKIVDQGALESLVQLMNAKNENEQLHAAKTVWTLCFDEYSRGKVKEEPDCVATLERLKIGLGELREVQHAASGALWKLQEEEAHRKDTIISPTEQLKSDTHIFLSYNHEHYDMVHQVKDNLKADGYTVWIDSEQMGGSTLEAMAEAVEKAAVVLICASAKYKESPNCRTEAEYTFQLKRPIVPLMMQRRYKPDGWLGMLMGAKMYINFDGKYEFDYSYQKLIREMLPYLNGGKSKDVADGPVVAATAVESFAAAPPTTPPIHVQRTYQAANWTKEQVQQWINKNDLNSVLGAKLCTLLSSMDGKLLVAFCGVKDKAGDFFYKQLCKQCDGDMLQMVHLTDALDQLP